MFKKIVTVSIAIIGLAAVSGFVAERRGLLEYK